MIERIGIITIQLVGFLLAARENEFEALYFEVDGQVYITPQPEQEAVPAGYKAEKNFWDYTSDVSIWDLYWDVYVVAEIASDMVEVIDKVANLFDEADGSVVSEIETPNLDGCDLDGCDLDGCDLSGCAP